MIKNDYSSPVLTIVSMGHTDVITTSNNEKKDVLIEDGFGEWFE